MLPANVLRLSAEHGQSDCRLDVSVSVDTRSNAVDDVVGYVLRACDSLLGDFSNCGDLVFCQFSCIDVMQSFDVICFYIGRKDGESMLDIHVIIELRNVNSCDFDLISWSCLVYKVIEQDNFLLSGNSSCRD